MSSKLSVTKNNTTRAYVGGELIYLDSAKTKQVKEIYVKKNNANTLVWQYDITAPTLTVNQDTSSTNYLLNTQSFTVSGSVSDSESGVKSVTVNGNTVTTSNGNWSTTITISYNTTTTITVVATDNAGNSVTKKLTVYATTASSRPTTLYSIDNSMNVNSWNSTAVGSYTVPKSAKVVTSDISGWTGDWGSPSCKGSTSIVDKTTGQTLASGSYSGGSSGSRSISVTLTKEQSYQHTIVINYDVASYTPGDSTGLSWGYVHAIAKGTASYY